jgi:formylglycine-generating enzyme required for sulfatase activity
VSRDTTDSPRVFGNPRTMMSRADLVRAFLAGEEAVRIAADALGLEQAPSKEPIAAPKVERGEKKVSFQFYVAPEIKPVPACMNFWRVERATEFKPTLSSRWTSMDQAVEAKDRPIPLTEGDVRRFNNTRSPRPRISPIAPWSRIRPVLAPVLSGEEGRGPIDLDRLVEQLCKVEWVSAMPRKSSLGAWMLHVVVDRSRRLVPFWEDQRMVLARLKKSLGGRHVKVHWLVDNVAAPEIGSGERLLALTDLGFLGSPLEKEEWRRLGDRLTRKGAIAISLVPCPKSRWTRKLSKLWNARDWSEPGRNGAAQGPTPSDDQLKERAEYLLKLLSSTLRIEPWLLREVRQALPRSIADLGSEADAWQHPALLGGSSEGSWIDPSTAKKWREEYQSLSAEHRRAAIDAMRRRHERQEYGIWEAEILSLSKDCNETTFLSEGEKKNARRIIRGILAAVPGPGSERGALDGGVEGWFQYLDTWVGRGVRQDKELGPEMLYARHKAQLPFDFEARERVLKIREQGGEFLLCAGAHRAQPRGRPVASIRSLGTSVRVQAHGEQVFAETLDPSAPRIAIPECDQVEIVSNTAVVTLCRTPPTPWANCFGWDQHGLYAELEVNQKSFKLRWIPPGSFEMGSPDNEPGRDDTKGPLHRVTIAQGFWLGETPVTQGQYEAVSGENPSYFQSAGEHAPVEQVDWHHAQAFCDQLTEQVAELRSGERFRLPSEAEWEYACRAGTTTALYTGAIEIIGERNAPALDPIAWYGGNSGVDYPEGVDSTGWPSKQIEHSKAGTHPVKEKGVNPWGLYDMLGNVWEWCEDHWHGSYNGAPGDGSAWADDAAAEGRYRVIRGGGWYSFARWCRSAGRSRGGPGYRNLNHGRGFRLVLAPSSREGMDVPCRTEPRPCPR